MLPVPRPPIGTPENSPSSRIGWSTRGWPTPSHGTPMPRRQAAAGMDGQSDARSVASTVDRAHLSTPVTTTPRMNARWARRKMTIGTAIVSSADAWMSVGWLAYSALYCWIAIDIGCSSGLLPR